MKDIAKYIYESNKWEWNEGDILVGTYQYLSPYFFKIIKQTNNYLTLVELNTIVGDKNIKYTAGSESNEVPLPDDYLDEPKKVKISNSGHIKYDGYSLYLQPYNKFI